MLFSSVLFYSVLVYSIPFYSILFYIDILLPKIYTSEDSDTSSSSLVVQSPSEVLPTDPTLRSEIATAIDDEEAGPGEKAG